MKYISKEAPKYIGNLHCHSTRSDGKSSVEELVNAYKNEGYNFLVMTDHRRVYNDNQLNTKGFIVIPGMEMDTWINPNPNHKFFHFQVIGDLPHDYSLDTPIFTDYTESMTPYTEFDQYLRIVNHPYWSRMEMKDLISLKPDIIEIYNHSSEVTNSCGYDLKTWDELLFLGHKVLGVATDDNHMKIDQSKSVKDYFGGVVVVQSSELTTDSIIENIKLGNFYSKMGVSAPDFLEISKTDNTIKVTTTNVNKIRFIAYNYHGKVIYKEKNSILNYGEFTSHGHKFVRIEIEDDNNLKAWSNPIYF